MNTKEADLPDNTYKLLQKKFGPYNKDGRPNPPGYRGPNPNDVRPVITGNKKKTFKKFYTEAMNVIQSLRDKGYRTRTMFGKDGRYMKIEPIPKPNIGDEKAQVKTKTKVKTA